MHVLVIGSGGREHAIAWKLRQSDRVSKISIAPGNAGTALADGMQNVDIATDNIDALINFAKENAVELTVVGPEAPLVMGIVDRFQTAGLRIFGPSASAAQLEGSKSFSKADRNPKSREHATKPENEYGPSKNAATCNSTGT